MVGAAFSRRRKTLRNALRWAYGQEAIGRARVAAGLDGGRRAETLTIDEFAALANAWPAETGAA